MPGKKKNLKKSANKSSIPTGVSKSPEKELPNFDSNTGLVEIRNGLLDWLVDVQQYCVCKGNYFSELHNYKHNINIAGAIVFIIDSITPSNKTTDPVVKPSSLLEATLQSEAQQLLGEKYSERVIGIQSISAAMPFTKEDAAKRLLVIPLLLLFMSYRNKSIMDQPYLLLLCILYPVLIFVGPYYENYSLAVAQRLSKTKILLQDIEEELSSGNTSLAQQAREKAAQAAKKEQQERAKAAKKEQQEKAKAAQAAKKEQQEKAKAAKKEQQEKAKAAKKEKQEPAEPLERERQAQEEVQREPQPGSDHQNKVRATVAAIGAGGGYGPKGVKEKSVGGSLNKRIAADMAAAIVDEVVKEEVEVAVAATKEQQAQAEAAAEKRERDCMSEAEKYSAEAEKALRVAAAEKRERDCMSEAEEYSVAAEKAQQAREEVHKPSGSLFDLLAAIAAAEEESKQAPAESEPNDANTAKKEGPYHLAALDFLLNSPPFIAIYSQIINIIPKASVQGIGSVFSDIDKVNPESDVDLYVTCSPDADVKLKIKELAGILWGYVNTIKITYHDGYDNALLSFSINVTKGGVTYVCNMDLTIANKPYSPTFNFHRSCSIASNSSRLVCQLDPMPKLSKPLYSMKAEGVRFVFSKDPRSGEYPVTRKEWRQYFDSCNIFYHLDCGVPVSSQDNNETLKISSGETFRNLSLAITNLFSSDDHTSISSLLCRCLPTFIEYPSCDRERVIVNVIDLINCMSQTENQSLQPKP